MRNVFYLISMAASMLLISCNYSGDKEKKEADPIAEAGVESCKFEPLNIDIDSCTGSGSANVVIEPRKAQRLIAHFGIFSPSTNGLQTEYWLDKCEIQGLNDFFNKESGHDGAWITFASANTASYKTYINIVPTKPDATGYYHKEDWAVNGSIPFPAGCANYGEHFRNSLDPGISKYRSVHIKEGSAGEVKDLSRKIWVSGCVFKALHKIIIAYSGAAVKLDGVIVYSAAYDSQVPLPQRGEGHSPSRPDQSTIILVPGYHCEGSDKPLPAWDVVAALYKHNVTDKMTAAAAASAYNHGELCPDRCATDDQ